MPLAQSMALPPPTATIRSTLSGRAKATPASTCLVVGIFLDVIEDEDFQARVAERLLWPAADGRRAAAPDR